MSSSVVKKRQTALSFVVVDEGGRLNYWDVKPTGDWTRDVATGRDFAAEAARYIHRHDEPMIMEKLVRSIFTRKELGGIEIGFLHRVGEMIASYPH